MQLLIREQIALRRKRLGMSQQQLGDKVNMSVDSINRIESGKVSPRVRHLILIAKELGAVLDIDLVEPNA